MSQEAIKASSSSQGIDVSGSASHQFIQNFSRSSNKLEESKNPVNLNVSRKSSVEKEKQHMYDDS